MTADIDDAILAVAGQNGLTASARHRPGAFR